VLAVSGRCGGKGREEEGEGEDEWEGKREGKWDKVGKRAEEVKEREAEMEWWKLGD
jgi:hypothetical protein